MTNTTRIMIDNISSRNSQTKRLRKKIVSVEEWGKIAECVEDRSVVIRSGTVQPSRKHPINDSGIWPMRMFIRLKRERRSNLVPKSQTNRTSKLYKKAKQNSSELAETRWSPTVYFGLNQKQEPNNMKLKLRIHGKKFEIVLHALH